MSFLESDLTKVEVGTLWKYSFENRQNPTSESHNPDFVVGAKNSSGNTYTINYGTINYPGEYKTSIEKFVNKLIPLGPLRKEQTQISSLMYQLKQCSSTSVELYDMLMELEI